MSFEAIDTNNNAYSRVQAQGSYCKPNAVSNDVEEVTNKNKPSEDEKTKNDEEMSITDVPEEKLKDAINQVNQKIRPTHTECQFSYHEETNRIAIKVIDRDTQEVIREIPPEKTLDMLAKAWELAGILVDEKR